QAPRRRHAAPILEVRKNRPNRSSAAKKHHCVSLTIPQRIVAYGGRAAGDGRSTQTRVEISQWDDPEKESRACSNRHSLRAARRHAPKGEKRGREDPGGGSAS